MTQGFLPFIPSMAPLYWADEADTMSTSRRNFIGASACGASVVLMLDSQPSKPMFAAEKPIAVGEPKFEEYSSPAIRVPRLNRAFSTIDSGWTSSSGFHSQARKPHSGR